MSELMFSRKIDKVYETDVAVIGGGPSGIASAIAAARGGVKTMLIERYGVLGGMATMGGVGPFMTSYDRKGSIQLIRGIFEEIVCRLEDEGGGIHPEKVRAGTSYVSFIVTGHDHCSPFDAEVLKLVTYDMVTEAGVKLLLHSTFVSAICEDGKIKGVVIINKSGLQLIKAKIYVDCTGDADVAANAGVPYILGNKDGGMQPATMFLRMGNVNSEKVKQHFEENKHKVDNVEGGQAKGVFSWIIDKAKENGDWNIPALTTRYCMGLYESSVPGEWRINTGRILDIDATDVEELTRAEIEGRKQAKMIFKVIKKYVPGCENANMLDTGAIIGVRETRHIYGQYLLNEQDLIEGKEFEDTIAVAANSIDNHGKGGGKGGQYTTINKDYYCIPYRIMVPQKVNNLLVSGRPVSASQDAAAAIRVMPPCFAMGQAAGVAAAICITDHTNPGQVNIKKLRERLKEANAYLGEHI